MCFFIPVRQKIIRTNLQLRPRLQPTQPTYKSVTGNPRHPITRKNFKMNSQNL